MSHEPAPSPATPPADGSSAQADWPSISIVIPNYNMASTLGEAIQSLLDQAYPRLELIIVDGGSTDGSVEVIQRYAQHIAWWVSERDEGQSHAINKGLARATGEVVNWLCADDRLQPCALATVARAFAADPAVDVVAGMSEVSFDDPELSNYLLGPGDLKRIELMPCQNPIAQPSCFYRRRLLRRDPPLDQSFHFGMDFDLWCDFKAQGARWVCLPEVLSVYPNDGTNKTSTGGLKFARDHMRIYRRYSREWPSLIFWHRWLRHPIAWWIKDHPKHPRRWRMVQLQKAVDRVLSWRYGAERVAAIDWRWLTPPSEEERQWRAERGGGPLRRGTLDDQARPSNADGASERASDKSAA